MVIGSFGFIHHKETEVNRFLWFDTFFNFYRENGVSILNHSIENNPQLQDVQLNTPQSNHNSENFNSDIITFSFSNDDSTKNEKELELENDSLKTAIEDTVNLNPMAIDSTARITHFKYRRKDSPTISLYRKKESKFFAHPSPNNKQRTIELDSTGKFVVVAEKIGGQTVKYILKIPLEEYIDLMLASREKEMWDQLGYAYELKESKKELGQLIKDITDFEIPLPSVGFLSIFGPQKISLKIGGAVDIHGAWRNETTEGITASRLGNTRNEPDFRQQVQINVNGTIGDKLQINADWNTERTFEYENQLKIKYTGYEDEIVQSVEAGNVSLQTSPLVGGGEALFGIKANFKMGPFTLTTLASQKKGETKEKSITNGATSQDFQIRAYNYSKNHFFISNIYADTSADLNLFNKYFGYVKYHNSPIPISNRQYFVKNIEVWKSINQTRFDPKERDGNAFLDLPAKPQNGYDSTYNSNAVNEVPGRIYKGRFVLLQEGVDYTIRPEIGMISFKTNIQDNEIIAVAYQVENSTSAITDDAFYGDFLNSAGSDTTRRLVLKLVKPPNLQPSFTDAWKLMLKNIYPVGGRSIKKEGFKFDIFYEVDGAEAQNVLGNLKLLNIFGLDIVDASDNPNPDGEFDFKSGLTIIPETGEIVFPVLQPFGRNFPVELRTPAYDSLRYLAIYDTTDVAAQQRKEKDKWILKGTYTGESTSTYQLGFNIVENSVRVTLNGRELTPGVDYYVDYTIGQLTIRNDAALNPGANLKISYEENDLFQLASKTLFGARGEYEFSRKTKLGFSALTLTQQTLSDKVRIGEEPLSNSIYGLDFQTSADLPFLTRAIDNIISTREMSTFSLKGEFAYMNPDPNTKKSNISSDNGKSIAYIDDFEGAKRIIPIGISYTSWKDLSVPNNLSSITTIPTLPDSLTIHYKAKSWWYNILPSNVNVKHIWPEKRVARGDEQVTVLDYYFSPSRYGTYNYNPKLDSPREAWGGMMKTLSSTANDLVKENIEFIEFWLKVESGPSDAKIFIDLGKISEDVIPNGRLDKEDKNFNELIDEGEDLGLDGLTDAEESLLLPPGVQRDDPSGDNFYFVQTNSNDPFQYMNINGTQGNALLTDVGRFPDTEDINKNGTLDQLNSYFRYEIPLTPDTLINPYVVGGGSAYGWYLYRIPLREFKEQIGAPSFTLVEFIRLFVTDATSDVHFRMTEFNLVGNQWQKLLPNDTTMLVSVINVEDNPNYNSPVDRERDRSRPDEEIYKNEQSLNLILNQLPYGESRQAVKYLYRPLDVFNYSEMKLFIHGDKETEGVEFFFRFGSDTNNFYEYRQKVDTGWNMNLSIPFKTITAIKQKRDSANVLYQDTVFRGDGSYYVYAVKGNPSLTQIKFLSVGLLNTKDSIMRMPVSGEVWVNELRVIGADDTPGWAYTFSTSLKFADVLSVSFNMSQTDPYFHRLSDRFGSRVDMRNWGINADLDVLKILPITLEGSNLKLNYSRTESVGKPLYLPNTDIRVDEAALQSKTKTPDEIKREVQTVNISDSYNASGIKLKIPVDHWLIRDSFNSLTYGFNYNKTFSRSPSVESNKSWVWNASINYAVAISSDYNFYLADIPLVGSLITLLEDYRNAKFFFTPQSFTWYINARRNRNITTTRAQLNADATTTIARDFTASRGLAIQWKLTEAAFLNVSTSYNIDVQSTLSFLEIDENNNQRMESDIWRDIFSGQFFGKDLGYVQTFDFRTSPRLPSLWDINKFFNISAGYNVRYQWQNNLQQAEFGRSAGYANRITTSLSLRLKALTEPLFTSDETTQTTTKTTTTQTQTNTKTRTRDFENQNKFGEDFSKRDSLITSDSLFVFQDSLAAKQDSIDQEEAKKPSALKNVWLVIRSISKFLIFDYETINITFNNDNNFSASGIYGQGTGFSNFWGIYNEENGPSRLFMLGLTNEPGRRAYLPGGTLNNNFSQKNTISLKTSKPLWEGAKIELNWNVNWSMNKSSNLQPNEDGTVTVTNVASSGTLDRSFVSLPPVFFLSVFKSGIKNVNELYDRNSANPNESLSSAFLQGFESLPLLSSIGFLSDVAKYVPRPNWRITWDGLEKYGIFKDWAKRVSLDHAYSSNYTEGWKIDPSTGQKVTQSQKINYQFAPLLGMNITFNQLWEGNLSGNIKYSAKSGFDLGLSSKNITESFSREVGITLNYSKSGFELPLFGVSLKNDIEFSFSYSNNKSSSIIYDMNNFKEEGTPQDGTTRVTLEPRIKYVISSRVTLTLFYKRSSVEPEGAARIPPSTINEAGLDVRILIQ